MFTVSIHECLCPWKPPFSRSSRSTCIKVLADRALAGKESLREAVARAFQKSRLRGTGAGRSPASGRRMNLGVGRGGRISIHEQPRRSATESTVSTFFLLTGGGHDIPAPAYLIHTHTSRRQLTNQSRLVATTLPAVRVAATRKPPRGDTKHSNGALGDVDVLQAQARPCEAQCLESRFTRARSKPRRPRPRPRP